MPLDRRIREGQPSDDPQSQETCRGTTMTTNGGFGGV